MAVVAAFLGGSAWNDRQYKTQRRDYIWLLNASAERGTLDALERGKLRRELRETREQLRLERAERPALADKPAASSAPN